MYVLARIVWWLLISEKCAFICIFYDIRPWFMPIVVVPNCYLFVVFFYLFFVCVGLCVCVGGGGGLNTGIVQGTVYEDPFIQSSPYHGCRCPGSW